jgi:hypothetical protein
MALGHSGVVQMTLEMDHLMSSRKGTAPQPRVLFLTFLVGCGCVCCTFISVASPAPHQLLVPPCGYSVLHIQVLVAEGIRVNGPYFQPWCQIGSWA